MLEIELRQATGEDTKFLWDVFHIAMKDYITQTRGEWNEQREESQFRHQLDSANRFLQIGLSWAMGNPEIRTWIDD